MAAAQRAWVHWAGGVGPLPQVPPGQVRAASLRARALRVASSRRPASGYVIDGITLSDREVREENARRADLGGPWCLLESTVALQIGPFWAQRPAAYGVRFSFPGSAYSP